MIIGLLNKCIQHVQGLLQGGEGAEELHARLKSHAESMQKIVDEKTSALQREIAERKKLEKELKEVRHYLDYIFENIPDALGIVDRHGRFVQWNKAAEELYGYSYGQIHDGKCFELYPNASAMEDMLSLLREEGGVRKYEIDMRMQDGVIKPMELSIRLLKNDEGKVTGSIALGRDLSETRKLLSALKTAVEEQVRACTELQKANSEANRMIKELEETRAALEVSNRHLTLTNQDLETTRDQLARAAHQAGMAEMAAAVLHNIGNALTSMNVRLGIVYQNMGSFTPQKYLAGILHILREKTGQLDQFLQTDSQGANMLPFFETVIQDLSHFMGVLQQDLDFLLGRVEHVAEIIALQQSYAGMKEASEWVDIDKVLQDALEMLSDSFNKRNITIRSRLGSPPRIMQNRGKLAQVILAVLRNAIDAIDQREALAASAARQGSRDFEGLLTQTGDRLIEVATEMAYVLKDSAVKGTEEMHEAVNGAAPSNSTRLMVKVAVSDTGIGIAPELMQRLFQCDFSTKPQRSGFGLHECANYIIALNGSITAESEGHLKGARVTIMLPVEVAS